MCVCALTAVVEDELLQAGELSAGGDVEAAAVQLPDLVMFHIQAFGVVVVQHGQAVGPCKGDTHMSGLSGAAVARHVCDSCPLEFSNSCAGARPTRTPRLPPQPTRRLLEIQLILSSSNLGGSGTEFSLRTRPEVTAGFVEPLVSFHQKEDATEERVKRLEALMDHHPLQANEKSICSDVEFC